MLHPVPACNEVLHVSNRACSGDCLAAGHRTRAPGVPFQRAGMCRAMQAQKSDRPSDCAASSDRGREYTNARIHLDTTALSASVGRFKPLTVERTAASCATSDAAPHVFLEKAGMVGSQAWESTAVAPSSTVVPIDHRNLGMSPHICPVISTGRGHHGPRHASCSDHRPCHGQGLEWPPSDIGRRMEHRIITLSRSSNGNGQVACALAPKKTGVVDRPVSLLPGARR